MEQTTERLELRAHLAAERAALLEGLLGLDRSSLVENVVFGDWTVKDILAHIAAWDRWEMHTMHSIVGGEAPDLAGVQDENVANAAFVAEWREKSLEVVIAELMAARSDWVDWFSSLANDEFYRPRSYFGHDWTFSRVPLQVQWQHDAEHAVQIVAWRETEAIKATTGPPAILLDALGAARDELLTPTALLQADERSSGPVCGNWTLQDLLGHVADWERYAAKGLRQMADNETPNPEPLADIESWNISHIQARQDQTWDVVWNDLHNIRAEFLEAVLRVSPDTMGRSFPFAWGITGTPYVWIKIFLGHDREHARDIRRAVKPESA